MALQAQLDHEATIAAAHRSLTRDMMEHDRDIMSMQTDVAKRLITALIERRVDVIQSGFVEALGLLSRQAEHFMSQQDKFMDAGLKASDPLDAARYHARLTEIDQQLQRIRSDARRLYREMNSALRLLNVPDSGLRELSLPALGLRTEKS